MKTDVYAFGITLWELFSFGKLPYVELDNRTVIKEVLLGLRPDIPKGTNFDRKLLKCKQSVLLKCMK